MVNMGFVSKDHYVNYLFGAMDHLLSFASGPGAFAERRFQLEFYCLIRKTVFVMHMKPRADWLSPGLNSQVRPGQPVA